MGQSQGLKLGGLGTELALAPGSSTSDLHRWGLRTLQAQAPGSEVCACVSRGAGLPGLESVEHTCTFGVMAPERGLWAEDGLRRADGGAGACCMRAAGAEGS